jgi:hypothetical protein
MHCSFRLQMKPRRRRATARRTGAINIVCAGSWRGAERVLWLPPSHMPSSRGSRPRQHQQRPTPTPFPSNAILAAERSRRATGASALPARERVLGGAQPSVAHFELRLLGRPARALQPPRPRSALLCRAPPRPAASHIIAGATQESPSHNASWACGPSTRPLGCDLIIRLSWIVRTGRHLSVS